MFLRSNLLAVLAGCAVFLSGPSVLHAEAVDLDPSTGLAMVGDWELVRNNCIACHSARLVTQQRGSAAQWLSVIRWMQEKQKLWDFDADTESRIITYLAENYPPQAAQRRPAIAWDLMPPNPYKAETTAPPSEALLKQSDSSE